MPNEVLVRPADLELGQQVTVWNLDKWGHRTTGQGGSVVACLDNKVLILRTPGHDELAFDLTGNREVIAEVPWALEECIQHNDDCRGDVEFFSPRGHGGPLRCAFHREQRMKSYENSMEMYADSDVVPDWFDPTIAGERWNEDD